MKYVKETRINAAPAEVFAFHESPQALESLIPPWENMQVVESAGSLEVGSRVVLQGRAGVIPLRWVAVHTEYDPPHLFADQQESGPFAYWYHRHLVLDAEAEDDSDTDNESKQAGGGGTRLRDEVAFKPPMGLIGRWLGGWLIRRKLERMFAYRHETTRRLVESGEWRHPENQASRQPAVA